MLLRVGATLQGEAQSRRRGSADASPRHAGELRSYALLVLEHAKLRHRSAGKRGDRPLRRTALSQQDKPMLEAQFRNMGGAEFWSMKPVLLPSDAAAVRVRRKAPKLMEIESPLVVLDTVIQPGPP